MNFAEFLSLPDVDRVLLFEVRESINLQLLTWTYDAVTSCYTASGIDDEIVAVEESGTLYERRASAPEYPEQFWWDASARKLYIRMAGSDAPTLAKYTLSGYHWATYCNGHREGAGRAIYRPAEGESDGAVYPVYYLPLLDADSLSELDQSVEDYYIGTSGYQFGSVRLLNDGTLYRTIKTRSWHNATARLLYGARGSAYSDLGIIFKGVVRNPRIDDESLEIETRDERMNFREIPFNHCWTEEFPYLEETNVGQPKPIILGRQRGVVPLRVDPVNFVYLFHDTGVGEYDSLDVVYRAGKKLDSGDYAENGDGTFTLGEDPGNDIVTCDVTGLRCDYDTSTPTFSDNGADILYWLLVRMNGLNPGALIISTFNDLKARRTQHVGYTIKAAIDSLRLIQMLQRSLVFQFLPTPEGRYGAYCYDNTVPAGTTKIRDEQIDDFCRYYETDTAHSRVVIKYGQDPATGVWKAVEYRNTKTRYLYGDERTLTVETLLTDEDEALLLCRFYASLVNVPADKIEGRLPHVLMAHKPTDKIIISKSIRTAEGEAIAVLSEDVYRILRISKSLKESKAGITAIEDITGTGGLHNDTEHIDSYTDLHTDEVHNDVAHKDVAHVDEHVDDAGYSDHSDSHLDAPHVDSYVDSHGDTAHADVPHEDAHYDTHGDAAHNDYLDGGFYGDEPYEDWPHADSHSDTIHEDVAYVDTYSDSHSDKHSDAHTDKYWDGYSDSYQDEPHADTPHVDSHGDVYSDEYSDEDHGDSNY